MVNFAREKRRQPRPSSPGGAQAGNRSSNTISGVQELLHAAMPTSEAATGWSPERGASGADAPSYHDMPGPLVPGAGPTTMRAGHGLQRRTSSRQPPPARLMPGTVSGASNLPGVEPLPWPVEPGAHVQGLINHCEASLVRYSSPVVRHSNMVLPFRSFASLQSLSPSVHDQLTCQPAFGGHLSLLHRH
jgi:hypothetical protein